MSFHLFPKGILLKFVRDVELAPGIFMYGGEKRADDRAYKAAGHELKGFTALYEAIKVAKVPVALPLTCVIDYRGYRLIAGISSFPTFPPFLYHHASFFTLPSCLLYIYSLIDDTHSLSSRISCHSPN